MKNLVNVTVIAILFMSAALTFGRPSYTGYSGAPGAYGRCASSCHGSGGGTIRISGFPEEYVPGQTYTISISHDGDSAIRQFNGSCRIEDGSTNAGVITAGEHTVTYNITVETNGIRFSSHNHSHGTFDWTAPDEGAGEARLYIAGQQGSMGGANSTIVLISQETNTGIEEENILPDDLVNPINYPNPFNVQTNIRFDIPYAGDVSLDIFNISGQLIESPVNCFLNSSASAFW